MFAKSLFHLNFYCFFFFFFFLVFVFRWEEFVYIYIYYEIKSWVSIVIGNSSQIIVDAVGFTIRANSLVKSCEFIIFPYHDN